MSPAASSLPRAAPSRATMRPSTACSTSCTPTFSITAASWPRSADHPTRFHSMAKKLSAKQVYLVASGDLRPVSNETCWPGQAAMEKQLGAAIAALGHKVVRGHPYIAAQKHGFIASQKE